MGKEKKPNKGLHDAYPHLVYEIDDIKQKKTRMEKHKRSQWEDQRDKVHVTRQREGDNNNTPNKLHSQFARSNPNDIVNLCYLYQKWKTRDNREMEVQRG